MIKLDHIYIWSKASNPISRSNERLILGLLSLFFCTLHGALHFSTFFHSSIDLAIFFTTIASRHAFLKRVSVYKDVASLVVWFYTELSLVMWPGVMLILGGWEIDAALGSRFASSASAAENEGGVLLAYRLGELCLITHAVIFLILGCKHGSVIRGKNSEIWCGIKNIILSKSSVIFVIGSFAITALAYKWGIGVLGGRSGVVLPFKLSGLINYIRLEFVPFYFIIFLDIFYNRPGKNRIKVWLLIYAVWLAFDGFARLSRGQIVFGIMPVLFWAMYAKAYRYKWLVYLIAPSLLFLVLLPVMSTYRDLRHYDQSSVTVKESISLVGDAYESKPKFFSLVALDIYERIFTTGRQVLKFTPYIENPYWSGNFSGVINAGGTPEYHTRQIDEFPKEIAHSSGATGISDAYLIGGVPFAIITMMLISFISVYIIDGERPRTFIWTSGIKAMSAWYIFMLLSGSSWSLLRLGVLPNLVWPFLFVSYFCLAKYAYSKSANQKKFR